MSARRASAKAAEPAEPAEPADPDETFVQDFNEQDEQQWWQTEQGVTAAGGAEFPGFVSRSGNERFEKLYADSATRIAKISRMREEASREQIEREQSNMRPTKRASKEELSEACNRLYGDAERRRSDVARKKEEQEYLENLHEELKIGGRSHSTPNLVKTGESRWDRLYASGAQTQRKLERERQIKAESEQQFLEDHSVHSKTGAPRKAFERLYNDGVQRGFRQEQRKRRDAENAQQELEQGSIHRNTAAANAKDVTDVAAERLYMEGKLRDQRHEARNMALEKKQREATHKTATPEHIAKRVALLYKDADRRTQDRQWMQAEFEKEHLASLLRQSVHASVRQNTSSEINRIFDKVNYEDRPRDVPPKPCLVVRAVSSRSARTPPPKKRSPEPAQARPATARRSLPGDVTRSEPILDKKGATRSATPPPATEVCHQHFEAKDETKAKSRPSVVNGFAPFARLSATPPPPTEGKLKGGSAGGKSVRAGAKAAPPPPGNKQSNGGAFMMTALVEQGAREALSAELPNP